MGEIKIENGEASRGGITSSQSLIDLLIVFVVSAVVFLGEGWANANEWIRVPAAATGVSAVIAGFVTAVALIFFRKQTLSEIGFRNPKRWWTVPIWAFGIMLVYLVAEVMLPLIIGPILQLPQPDLSRYDALYQNLPAVIAAGLILPLTASIPEELIYRGFLMDRLTRIFGNNTVGNLMTVLVQALIFGSIHFQWGLGGMIVTSIMGVIWGTAFLLCGRNLWIVIFAHSLGHILMVTQLYFVKASELGTS